MNDDILFLKENIDGKISGPWRLSVWERPGFPPSYVFSEEHENKGSCPDENSITSLMSEILHSTKNVHVFIEHFLHGDDILNTSKTVKGSCVASEDAVLNNMRNCLEVIKIKNIDGSKKDRIHFIDPRADLVAILPNGNVYKSIEYYVKHLLETGDKEKAIMTIYEAYIHPLLSLFPDKLVMSGRLSGSMEKCRNKMTNEQKKFFDLTWKEDVIGRISELTREFSIIQKKKSISLSSLEHISILYRDMTNKFLDTWLLSRVFIAQNDANMTASVIYLGSLHSLNFEKYLEKFGHKRKYIVENRDLSSCISVKF